MVLRFKPLAILDFAYPNVSIMAVQTVSEGGVVRKVNLFEFYRRFGRDMAKLGHVRPGEDVRWPLAVSRIFLEDPPPQINEALLPSSKRAAKSLSNMIKRMAPEGAEDIDPLGPDLELDSFQTHRLSRSLKEFESVLQNDMPDISAYVVAQKGIYRTDDLIERAEQQLSQTALKVLPPKARADIQQAGKCLAYEVPTACAFHLWRAVESVMDVYHEKLTGKTFKAAKVHRNWAAYLTALNDANADKRITEFLKHIKDAYRNPVAHPEEILELEEAQQLFGAAVSSLDQMLKAIA